MDKIIRLIGFAPSEMDFQSLCSIITKERTRGNILLEASHTASQHSVKKPKKRKPKTTITKKQLELLFAKVGIDPKHCFEEKEK